MHGTAAALCECKPRTVHPCPRRCWTWGTEAGWGASGISRTPQVAPPGSRAYPPPGCPYLRCCCERPMALRQRGRHKTKINLSPQLCCNCPLFIDSEVAALKTENKRKWHKCVFSLGDTYLMETEKHKCCFLKFLPITSLYPPSAKKAESVSR